MGRPPGSKNKKGPKVRVLREEDASDEELVLDNWTGAETDMFPELEMGSCYPTVPMRMCVLGPSGSGKTTFLTEHVLVKHPLTYMWFYCETQKVIMYESGRRKRVVEKWGDTEVDIRGYDELRQLPSNEELEVYLKNNKIQHHLKIFDDYEETSSEQKAVIKDLAKRGRKFGVSVIIMQQDAFSVPVDMLQNCTNLVLCKGFAQSYSAMKIKNLSKQTVIPELRNLRYWHIYDNYESSKRIRDKDKRAEEETGELII